MTMNTDGHIRWVMQALVLACAYFLSSGVSANEPVITEVPAEAGAGDETEAAPIDYLAKLDIAEDTRYRLSGGYEFSPDVRVHFDTRAPAVNLVRFQVKINQKPFDASFDLERETLRWDGHGTVLEDDEKQALFEAAQAVIEYSFLHYGEVQVQTFMLVRMMEYWSAAPPEYKYEKQTAASSS